MPRLSTLLSPLVVAAVATAATVQLGYTNVVGADREGGIEFFGGIPFAEPPVGKLRFQPPVLKPFLDVSEFNATTLGTSCLQVKMPTFADIPLPPNLSEDCLSINVFRPAGVEADAKLPVLVYDYGGGFIIDAIPGLDPSAIIKQSVSRGTPIMFVSFNYRLGPLGFPAGAEAAEKGALNLGLRDQIAAFEWIQRNIGAFGGDKDKVTLFGISAGSVSINTLYLNAELEKYARGAILQSGSTGSVPIFDAYRRQQDWNNFVSGIEECASSVATNNTFECLQREDIDPQHIMQGISASLAQTGEQMPWVPMLDGPDGFLPELPHVMFEKGRFSKIPFIAGNTLDEVFIPPTIPDDEETLRQAIISNYTTRSFDDTKLEEAVDRLLVLYPDIPALGSPFNTGNQTFNMSSEYKPNDVSFHSNRRLWTQSATKAGVKAYGYLFTYPELAVANPALGIRHGLDVNFVFGFTPIRATAPTFQPSPSASKLSQQMIDYMVSFVTTLDPNDGLGSERPLWPQYTPESESLLQLNGPNTTVITDNYRAEQIEFINSHSEIFRH
ncbi:extracellular triacylglycerol lipase precursor [Moniliophthora roreri]|nr:extracellular triacylglycerol lipase precursor [Moniliophthora roreri]